jgi:hypothetical protein
MDPAVISAPSTCLWLADRWLAGVEESEAGAAVWLTRAQAARRYNISEDTLDRLSRRAGFPVHREGRLIRYSR